MFDILWYNSFKNQPEASGNNTIFKKKKFFFRYSFIILSFKICDKTDQALIFEKNKKTCFQFEVLI
jgi:hypothetical protein